MVRRAIQRLVPSQEIIYSVLEGASAFIADLSRSRIDLIGGLVLFREANALYIARPDAELPLDAWPQMPKQMDSMRVSLPAKVPLSGGWQFSAEIWQLTDPAWEQSSNNKDCFRVWLDADKLSDKLELRIRRPGDRFEPLGLKGHSQKLSDFFTNAKLLQRARARWPLLCSGDTVIWVPGYRPAEIFKLKETSHNIVYFELTYRTEKTEK